MAEADTQAAGMARTKGAIERSSAFKDGNEVDGCSVDCGRGLRTRELTAGNPAAGESQKAFRRGHTGLYFGRIKAGSRLDARRRGDACAAREQKASHREY